MKICDLAQSYTPKSGGVRTYIEEKRAYIRDSTGMDHVLVVPGESDGVERDGRLTVHRVASPFIPGCEPYRMVLALDRVTAILRDEMPDVIELDSAYTLPWAAFRHQTRHECAIAGYYHTDFPTAYVETAIAPILGKPAAYAAKSIAIQYARHIYNRCTVTVTPSALYEDLLRRYGVDRVVRIPHGVDTAVFSPGRRDHGLRRSLGVGDGDVMLVYAGRLDSEKRINILTGSFDILRRHGRFRLVLIGDGPSREALDTADHRSHGLHVLPYQDRKSGLAALLASADIYVTAGPFETFGLSVLEAQSCGLPVAGVKAGALVERVTPGTGVLCRPDCPSALADAVLSIAATGPRVMGLAAREMVLRTSSWDRTFERLIDLYREFLPASAHA